MAERVLITGATGFVGSHLIEFLMKEIDAEIYGTRRRRSDMNLVKHVSNNIQWIEMELTDAHNVLSALKEVKPSHIYHLAAQSFVPTSWKAPQETFMTNAIGTVNLLEAVKVLEMDAKIQIAGSSEEYGYVKPEELPITETNPLRPLSPYGVSKVTADLFGRQHHRSFGTHVVITRAFNHTGPRRGDMFAESNFGRQIVEIEKGLRPPEIQVGNLEAKRDYTDVRDVVRAYWLALEKGKSGEVYNICSGNAIRIQELLNMLLALTKIKNIQVKQDSERMRPSDVLVLQGDCSKFRKETGWTPKIPLEKTLQDLLDYWRGVMNQRQR